MEKTGNVLEINRMKRERNSIFARLVTPYSQNYRI
jgi:hypothetical protein